MCESQKFGRWLCGAAYAALCEPARMDDMENKKNRTGYRDSAAPASLQVVVIDADGKEE